MDEINADLRPLTYPTKIDELKAKLSEQDFKELMEAINNPTINQNAIRRVLRARGITVSAGWLSQFRTGL
jgi:ribosomal protein L12E/L44/L45/RPP1/RPP2